MIALCYFYAQSKDAQALKNRYQLKLDFTFELAPVYYTSGFDYPQMPVITNDKPDMIQNLTWGLIPAWIKSPDQAEEIRSKTLNSRSDSIFEKPSFRNAIRQRRCIIPTTGFYEWREVNGKKYPYYIYLKNEEIFSFAGIWESWCNYSTGELLQTYSIVTTDANSLMAKIHNTKKRMPLILPREAERNWLDRRLNDEAIRALMVSLDDQEMEARTISKLITSRERERNIPVIQDYFDYPELNQEMQ